MQCLFLLVDHRKISAFHVRHSIRVGVHFVFALLSDCAMSDNVPIAGQLVPPEETAAKKGKRKGKKAEDDVVWQKEEVEKFIADRAKLIDL